MINLDVLPKLEKDNGIIDLGDGEYIDNDDFVKMFGNAESLSDILEIATPRWADKFNRWQERGILVFESV
jgi:hypothetical protein